MGDRDPREPEPAYRLAAIGREEAEDERLGLLERIFDPGSRRRRALVQPGWRCLEIGAGRGSMAVWLARQVGERGQVVATDIDVTYLQRLDLPNLEVRRHNILEDSVEVLGPRSFDLVCSRLVLFWLVGRQEEAIRRMVEGLRPGGWLVDEDGDWGTVVPVDPAHPLYERYHRIWRNGEWWAERGYDPAFGRKLPALFERCGLQNILHEASAEVVRGTSAWARWWLQTLEVMRATDRVANPTQPREEEYAVLTAPWTDPSFWFLSALLHGCSGQRPV
ncbi:MAG TPA: methyltransferase domain-containing protein [Candidatus Binatia bacterium]|nr:methyltransferase domain-containing protein [Candidatus Binatia bacterium]